MPRNRFTNPADSTYYDWTVNHTEEDESGSKQRAITRTSNTGNVGLVKQQGEDGPTILRYTGTILDRSQLAAFWAWFKLCKTQTIYFKDFDNQQYEVQITAFQPKRHRRMTSVRRDASMPQHYWTYTIELEVYRFISGVMATAGIAP